MPVYIERVMARALSSLSHVMCSRFSSRLAVAPVMRASCLTRVPKRCLSTGTTWDVETNLVHGGAWRTQQIGEEDGGCGAVVPPLHLSATFELPNQRGLDYARAGHPNLLALEELLESLETGACWAVAYASGLAALSAILHARVESGAHVVVGNTLYGGSYRLFEAIEKPRLNLTLDFADLSDPETLPALLKPDTALVFFETPTNPTMRLVDIQHAVACVRKVAPRALVVVDNTFMGPLYQSPLSLGADVVLHSLTKYLGGHGDVIGGALLGSDQQLFEELKLMQRGVGSFLQPFECYLATRGIRTLHLRMERAQQTAHVVADFLQGHSCVAEVLYPGLSTFPQKKLKEKQMLGSSGMISFILREGNTDHAALQVLSKLRLWRSAVSLGSVTSYAQHPATMTHATVPPEVQASLGITPGMLRLSCGVECAADLVQDLRDALASL